MVTQLTEYLYIGDIQDAREREVPADVTVTVCQDSVEDNVSGEYYWFNMSDGPENSYGGDSSYALFEKACETVLTAIRDGKAVFVHCHMGQSRSAAVCTAVLAVYEQMHPFDADNYIRRRRTIQPDKLLREHVMLFVEEKRPKVLNTYSE